ncbi:MAG TPA: AIR carboxylase family protein, partial [Candidatus Poseidoniia archaeon]|nr:AIR carboxylase family protein [Candidatus Poseidoniia archaeon]
PGNLDSLLSVVQMPPGVPVAAVGIGRGENAALLAARILGITDQGINNALESYRQELEKKTLDSN